MSKLTKKQEEIEQTIRNISEKHSGFKFNPDTGLTGISDWAVRNKQLNPIDNHKLSPSQMRQAMTEKEYNDPRWSYLTYDRVCRECGAKLTYNERMGKICKACEAKKEEERRKAEREAALARIKQAPGKNLIEKILASNPDPVDTPPVFAEQVTETEPVKSTVTFLKPEEHDNNVCRVSTIHELMQHAPDRAIVFINIENYNPTFNNYYNSQPEQK